VSDWLARLRALPGRLTAPAPAAPAPAAAPAPPAPTATAATGGVVVVTVLGLSGEALEKVLDLVQAECRGLGRKPVLVTDGFELTPFRRRRLIVEQVPDAEAMAVLAPDLPWRLYRERLFALLGRRWRPTASVSFGRRPDAACLAALERR
jgi:hypothetical protein